MNRGFVPAYKVAHFTHDMPEIVHIVFLFQIVGSDMQDKFGAAMRATGQTTSSVPTGQQLQVMANGGCTVAKAYKCEYEKGWPTQPSSSTVSWHTKLLALAEQKEAPAQDDEVPQLNMKGEGLRLCSEKTR